MIPRSQSIDLRIETAIRYVLTSFSTHDVYGTTGHYYFAQHYQEADTKQRYRVS
jgi:hypothetical protein